MVVLAKSQLHEVIWSGDTAVLASKNSAGALMHAKVSLNLAVMAGLTITCFVIGELIQPLSDVEISVAL